MSESVSVLYARHPVVMAKRWLPDGQITPYDNAKLFKLKPRAVNNIHELSSLLSQLEKRSNACVIRGEYVGDEQAAGVLGAEYQDGFVMRRRDVFKDRPSRMLLVEVDNYKPLLSDPVTEPVESISEYVTEHLPACFHGASYHWQLSNSAGHAKNKGVLKAHIWFWLDTPYNSDTLRLWGKSLGGVLDVSVFNPVQVHYTAAPVFSDGASDPVPVRSGFEQGELGDSVALIIRHDIITQALLEASKPTRLEHLREEIAKDEVAQKLYELGMVKSENRNGSLNVQCPFEDAHGSGAGAESSTIYFPANTGGYAAGHFKCLHEACNERTDGDYTHAIGLVADDFDVVELTEEEAQESEAAAAANEATLQAQAERFRLIDLADFAVGATYPYLVKTVVPKADLVVLFGESGSGKSFFAWDLCAHIARGEPWRGHRVRRGKVVYVCAEGAQGFRKRVMAYCQHHGIDPAQLDVKVIADAPNFLTDTDHKRVARQILSAWGQVDLIVIDTLAQTTPGANENAAEDMGKALGRLKELRRVTGATILLVHHSGKDASKGARGWSGLKAAADAEIEITRLDRCRVARVSKSKDDKDNIEFGFDLEVVNIGVDEDDDVISSCVAVAAEIDRTDAVKSGKYLGAIQKLVMEVIGEMAQYQSQNIEVKFVIDGVVERMPPPENGERDTRKQKVRRAIKELSKGDDAPLFMEDDVLSVL